MQIDDTELALSRCIGRFAPSQTDLLQPARDHAHEDTGAADPREQAEHIAREQHPEEGRPHWLKSIDQCRARAAHKLLHPVHHEQTEGHVAGAQQQHRHPGQQRRRRNWLVSQGYTEKTEQGGHRQLDHCKVNRVYRWRELADTNDMQGKSDGATQHKPFAGTEGEIELLIERE